MEGTRPALTWRARWPDFAALMRLDRPVGIYLLLWPTLWALWLAAGGMPRLDVLLIFVLGVIVMRSAGCVINDYADREFDGSVERTRARPLATGRVAPREALVLFVVLCAIAFTLVLFTNALAIQLSFAGAALATLYPFSKRVTHLPQFVLGAAFGWCIPMAYAAQANALTTEAWLLFTANLFWTVAYDTEYAMVDRDDDLRIGVKSTAILFGRFDRAAVALLQVLAIATLAWVGQRMALPGAYWVSLVVASGLLAYQQWLIRHRDRDACFAAFKHNNYVGMAVFLGIAIATLQHPLD